MFTIDDLWRIMTYLKDGTVDSELSDLTTSLATSEKELTNTFFEQILDQQNFNSDDYRRLRTMFIDWYSSHKTIATTQRYASDVHQLPDSHLNELFKSFGFSHGLDLETLSTSSKANFFLDLVNFYKKKGTPETLVDVLDYYGYADTDLIEYWLQKDEDGELVFRGESVRQVPSGAISSLTDIPYEVLVNPDPHWMQSRYKILTLANDKEINFPSKTPYFSLNFVFSSFNVSDYILSSSILFKIIEDQYVRHDSGLEIANNIYVEDLNLWIPLLHLYVGLAYSFKKYTNSTSSTSYTDYNCYNGTIEYTGGSAPVPINLSDITDAYQALNSSPVSHLDRKTKLDELVNDWSKPLTQNFLNSIDAAEDYLDLVNPSFKAEIDTYFTNESYTELVNLFGVLDDWIRENINVDASNLALTMFGIDWVLEAEENSLGLGITKLDEDTRNELIKIINFFKPYRARLIYMDTQYALVFKNPLTDFVGITDNDGEEALLEIQDNIHDCIRPAGGYCQSIDPTKFDFKALIDLWIWDNGHYFDKPPLAPEIPNYLPIVGCENLEWWYDIGKRYDIPIPPEYLNFKYDAGGYYDIIPYLQRCLMEVIKYHPDCSGICDHVHIIFADHILLTGSCYIRSANGNDCIFKGEPDELGWESTYKCISGTPLTIVSYIVEIQGSISIQTTTGQEYSPFEDTIPTIIWAPRYASIIGAYLTVEAWVPSES